MKTTFEEKIRTNLNVLFEKTFNEKTEQFEPLPAHGSNRLYFRISSKSRCCIGAYNEDYKENKAYISLTKHFLSKGLPVPKLYEEDIKQNVYLVEDLGNLTLYDYLLSEKKDDNLPANIMDMYKKVLTILPKFQVEGAQGLDFSICYPRSSFDKQSMMWDLNYFKYYFLKFSNIPFNEQDLEDDFHCFSDFLLTAKQDFFLYRDFQSRNVMIYENNPFFIDFQGGRRGALQYDIASLLYDAKADISESDRSELLDDYIDRLNQYITVDTEKFMQHYYGFVLLRIMQAFGAYGFRGYYEKKEHFLKSIPYAVKNLKYLLNTVNLAVKIPALYKTWEKITKLKIDK